MKRSTSILVLCLLLLPTFLLSCGQDDDDDTFDRQEEQAPPEPSHDIFFTRLTNNLAFRGRECQGNEVIMIQENGEEREATCERTQWVITVDNKNICSDGRCTEIFVYPFVGVINFSRREENLTFFSIVPVTQVDQDTRSLVESHEVRFESSAEPVVISK